LLPQRAGLATHQQLALGDAMPLAVFFKKDEKLSFSILK
jgi:hypothetical protein